MSVVEFGRFRSSAQAVGISEAEWAVLRRAGHPDVLCFYLELRRSLALEYAERRPFHLPARWLAEQGFLPHRRDRKLYMRLTAELLDVGLIERVKKAGFSADGHRLPATFMFTGRAAGPADGVVFLAHYRKLQYRPLRVCRWRESDVVTLGPQSGLN
jgi:hypothetical protein